MHVKLKTTLRITGAKLQREVSRLIGVGIDIDNQFEEGLKELLDALGVKSEVTFEVASRQRFGVEVADVSFSANDGVSPSRFNEILLAINERIGLYAASSTPRRPWWKLWA